MRDAWDHPDLPVSRCAVLRVKPTYNTKTVSTDPNMHTIRNDSVGAPASQPLTRCISRSVVVL